ncbi:MAG: NADH-quinone oxidoreductase subunit NuoN [Nitriliruptorales bacterium]|nr:NADH-quinone oxidoreductase subunit NuoN [Nitriliruptorales bacterium]
MTILAQAVQQIDVPQIAWGAISPELVLFGFGIVVLLLETAGRSRVGVSAFLTVVVLAAAALLGWRTGETLTALMVALAALATMALTLIWRDRPRMLSAILTALGFVGALAATGWQWAEYAGAATATVGSESFPIVGTATAIGDMVAVDGVALFTRFTVCIAGLLTIPLGYAYAESRRIHRGEYYPLLLFSATGMTLLASSADLIMVFISIEILSLSLYILTAFARRDLNSQEAAFKYFLLGAFSSALLLYGIAVTYGIAGTTNIAAAGAAFATLDAPQAMTLTAMGLLVVGFGFKTAIVPFHMWTPDVYQGAPTPVTGFMAAATKAAAFAAFARLFVGSFANLQWTWVPAIWVLAVATMLLGAILAVVQQDVKRMLGYSAVAHAGYVLLGLTAVTRDGVSSLLLYLLIYAVTSLGAFGVLSLLERRTRKAMALDDLRGVGRRYPVPAGMFALFLLSLAGIPGTAGFIAKFAVFRSAVEAGQILLVAAAVLSSLIAFFFYIRVIVVMFMDEEPAEAEFAAPLISTTGMSAGLAVAAAVVVVVGLVPGLLLDLARQAASFAG